jgi:PKD repeat protein
MKPLTCKILLVLALLTGLNHAVAQSLTVQFTENYSSGYVPMPVQFNCPSVDSGGNTITSWNWNFGDGQTSTLQNPQHTYNALGSYTPSLTAFNIHGATVVGSGPPVFAIISPVNFTDSPTNGQSPLMVQFSGPSTYNNNSPISSWNWNFGDGSSSTLQSPSHVYTNAGIFYPTLSVSGTYGSTIGNGPFITVTSLVYSVDWFKVAGGGGTSTGGVYTVSGTFGQQDASGSISGGGYTVTFGFWSLLGQGAPALIPTVPIITSQPQSLFVTNGYPAAFNVAVSGTPPFFISGKRTEST